MLVVDRLSDEQRLLVSSFAARSPGLTEAARRSVAASVASAIRPYVPGAADVPDDVDLVLAVARAIEGQLARPAALPVAAAVDPGGDVSGRRYLLSRLDDLVAAGALDERAATRVREVVERELADIAAAAAPIAVPVPVAPRAVEPSGPTLLDRIASATATFGTEQTPSLLLYIGAFLVVVAAFIFVGVSGDQLSGLVKLVLMLLGTASFVGAGIACHRYPRVLPAGRTFLVIGALIAPLDVAAYYAIVAHVSPLDAPLFWTIGSVACAVLYVGLRLGGYGVGYSYLAYAATISAVFGAEALAAVPLAWAAVPIAALALVIERLTASARGIVAIVLGPLPRMTVGVAALAAIALAIPFEARSALERAGLPAGTALLALYYVLRSPAGTRWERLAAAVGPAVTMLGIAHALDPRPAVLGLGAVAVGCAYLAPDLVPAARAGIVARAPWTARDLPTIGLVLIVGGLLPLDSFSSAPILGAAAYLLAAVELVALSLVWDDRPGEGPLAERVTGPALLGAGAIALAVGYRFAVAGVGLLPLSQLGLRDLARAYAPLSFAAWLGVLALRRRPAHARVAALLAAPLAVAVSVGTYPDALVHAVVNAIDAAGAAVVAIRVADRRPLWLAATAATLSALGVYRWSGAPFAWAPIATLVPAVLVSAMSLLPLARRLRGASLEAAVGISVVAVAVGLYLSPSRAPWDADPWRTAMIAVAAAGAFAAAEAWRRRSALVGAGAAIALPVLVDMAVLMTHPALPEPLTAPFAVYAFAAAWIARRSAVRGTEVAGPALEYIAAALAVGPTVARASDFATLLAALGIAFVLLAAAGRWPSIPIARVALVALVWLAVTRVFVDPRIDEIRIAAGALLLTMAVVSVRSPRLLRLPEIGAAELVAAGLVVVPTAAVTLLDPGASHFDVPVPLLLCIELGALYAVAVAYERVVLLRAIIGVSCVAALEFVALARFGEWYAALLGSAMINAGLGVARRWPGGRALREHMVLGVVGVGVLFLPSLGDSLAHPTFDLTAEVLAAGIGLVAAAGLLGEAWITGAALGVIGVEGTVVMRLPSQLQIPAVAAGAALLAIAVAFPRFRRRGLPVAFSTAIDLIGLWLFLGPTFLLTFTKAAALQHAVLMAQLVVLTLVGLTFRRRWQIIAALAMLGSESIRGILEIVNRIPSFATFAIAGSLLLAIGFLLLLKRELVERWRRRLLRWWVTWLAAAS